MQELVKRIRALEKRLEKLDAQTEVDMGFNDSNFSAFGRLRVAGEGSRSDAEFIYDKQPLLFDDISSGTGTATHQTNERDILLTVGGAASGATAGMRHHYNVPYTPGNGQLIDITGTADNAAIGGGTMYVFLRTTVSGSTVLAVNEPMASWSEISKINLSDIDWSDSQIFAFDFQSLKVGRVRFYLNRDGHAIKVHEIYNDNVRQSGFWQYPSLPPYWKLYNDGTNTIYEIGYGDEFNGIGFRYVFNGTQSTATSVAICETVKSEGGDNLFDLSGFPFTAYNSPTAAVSVTSTTVYKPVLSIRPAATFNSLVNRAVYIPQLFEITTDNPIFYKIIYRPTLTGASWAAVDALPYTGLENDVTATAISGGYEIKSGSLATGRNSLFALGGILGRIILSLGYNGTSDILTLAAVKTTTTNASVYNVFEGRIIR